MQFSRRFQGYAIDVLIGRRRILAAKAAIEEHRNNSGQSGQTVTSVDWFLSKRVIWGELPLVLLIRREGILQGVVLLYYSRAFGIPYGLARGGRRGDASVIAPVADQRRVIETAAKFLVQHSFAHTVVLTVPYRVPVGDSDGWNGSDTSARWFARDDPQRLDLAGGLDATMQRFSYKMRRNLRYYRRRAAVEAPISFVPELSPGQRSDAIAALSDKGRFPTALSQAKKWDRALQAVPGSFAMGLQSGRGNWLSLIAGWREPSATYIDWQLNDERVSTSTVMRSFLLEHETARHSPALVFVGGTSAIWQRACDPAIASDLVVTGNRPVARLLRGVYQRLKPDTDVSLLVKCTSPSVAGSVRNSRRGVGEGVLDGVRGATIPLGPDDNA